MALDRDRILSSVGYPTEEIEIEEWGGVVTCRGIPLGHDQLNAYLAAPMSFPVDADIAGMPKLGKGASASEKAAARIAAQIASKAVTADWRRPDIEEIIKRQTVGAVILGVIGPDGEPLFGWDDTDLIRRQLSWSGVLKAAEAVLRLSQGPEPAPTDAEAEESITEAEEPDEGKDFSATSPD